MSKTQDRQRHSTRSARADRFIVTRAELARLLRCPPDRLTKHVSEGMPVVTTGGGRGKPTQFDLGEALPWILERRTGSQDEGKNRYFTLQGDKIEQEIRRRAGELVEASEVDRQNAARTLAARERLLQIPGTAIQCGLIATPEQEDELTGLVHDALRELAGRGGYVEP